jgi:hypothetical protein
MNLNFSPLQHFINVLRNINKIKNSCITKSYYLYKARYIFKIKCIPTVASLLVRYVIEV